MTNRATVNDIAQISNNLNQAIKDLTNIDDVANHYTPQGALDLIQLISSMHGAFDNIIQIRKVATSFEMLSNVGFEYGLTLLKILDSKGLIRDNGITSGADDMRKLFFGSVTPDKDSNGLLMWYLETNNVPILCEIINPYDDDARGIASLIKNWNGWENLTGKKREDYIKYQKKQTGTSQTIPEPVVWDKIIQQYPDLEWGPGLRAKIDGWSKEKKASASDEAKWWKANKPKKIRDEPFGLPAKLKEHLGASGVPNLDPEANKWMKGVGTPGFKLGHDKIITIQQLTVSNFEGDPILSAVGREIKLDSIDKLKNCVLIPSINKGVHTERTLFNSNISQSWPDDIFLTGSAITNMPPSRFEGARDWKGIFDKVMRDNYGQLGNPGSQNDVDYLLSDTPSGKNPTPGREGAGRGLVCAICAGVTPRPGKKREWMTPLRTDSQTWDVDHIANLIFNELFGLNDSAGDGKGFLNTCGSCNRQFKSEKIWSPSYNLWTALLVKASGLPSKELGTLKARYPWPGLAAPGILKSGKPPFEGYRVYMTQAYYTDGDQNRANTEYESIFGQLESNRKVKAGVKIGNSLQQANGIDFSNRQEKSMRTKKSGKMQIYPFQLEAIILNRFYLITKTTLGSDAVKIEEEKGKGKEVIYGAYSELIDIYPIAANVITVLQKTRNTLKNSNVPSESQDARQEALLSKDDIENDSWKTALGELYQGTLVTYKPKSVVYSSASAHGSTRLTASGDLYMGLLREKQQQKLLEVKEYLRNLQAQGGLTTSPMESRTRDIPYKLLYENLLGGLVKSVGERYLFQLPQEVVTDLAKQTVAHIQPGQIKHQNAVWRRELEIAEEALGILQQEKQDAFEGIDTPGHRWHSPQKTGKREEDLKKLEREIQMAAIRSKNSEVFIWFGNKLKELKTPPRIRCGLHTQDGQIISNPKGAPETLEREIRFLRAWYASIHQGNAFEDDADQHLADEKRLLLTEQDNGGSGGPDTMHWWTGKLIFRALHMWCGPPSSQWFVVKSEYGEQKADGIIIQILDRQDVNDATVVIEIKNMNHWIIKVKPPDDDVLPVDGSGFYTIPDPAGDGNVAVPFELAFNRNGGDCGPAVTALAIRYKMNPQMVCLVLAKYEALQQSRVLEMEVERMRKVQKQMVELIGEKAQVATELARYKENQIFNLERLQQLNELLLKIDTQEGLENFKSEIAKEIAGKSHLLPGNDPGSKRKRSGGKRTRKKRRKRGKTKRKRKYRKKTKGRKRRRKKRTRRK